MIDKWEFVQEIVAIAEWNLNGSTVKWQDKGYITLISYPRVTYLEKTHFFTTFWAFHAQFDLRSRSGIIGVYVIFNCCVATAQVVYLSVGITSFTNRIIKCFFLIVKLGWITDTLFVNIYR